jgi:hypothetical protein
MHKALLPAISSVALLGCAGEPPSIVKGDGSFVTVTRPEHTKPSAVKEVAQSYCDQYGKHATMLSDVCPDETCPEKELTFWCR